MLRTAATFAAVALAVGDDFVPTETEILAALGDDDQCAGLDAEECSSKLIQLRGNRARTLAAVDTENEVVELPEGTVWLPLGTQHVAQDEGKELFQVRGDPQFCGEVCSKYPGCKSFAYCGAQACYLKAATISASTASVGNQFCTTYYPGPPGSKVPDSEKPADGTPPAKPAGKPADEKPAGEKPADEKPKDDKAEESTPSDCKRMKAKLAVNKRQEFKDNPDAKAHGDATLLLCANGTILGNVTVEEAASDIIAVHIHHCKGGEGTAATCAGPPVVNFCGDNSAGLIADGVKYTMPCSGFEEVKDGYGDSDGSKSVTLNMPGAFTVLDGPESLSAVDRISAMEAHADEYYFNVHTMASYNHFYPKHEGLMRGELEADEPKPAAKEPKHETDPVEDECNLMFSQMMVNELQEFKGNPDNKLKGYTDLVLCTNGTLRATLLVYGGVSEIIATHIHMCQGENDLAKDGCEGPPVINFCGINGAGSIDDGTKYPMKCEDYNKIGASRTKDTEGILIEVTNPDTTLAERVKQISENPGRFYFNVHTMASWNHWYPKHHGSCRGALEFAH